MRGKFWYGFRRFPSGRARRVNRAGSGAPGVTTVARMKTGHAGVVIEFVGGHGLDRRLQALGIRPGKRIVKVSSMLGRGPVTVRVDSSQIALGFGMADKIMIQLDVE